jgi:hypothetical protein
LDGPVRNLHYICRSDSAKGKNDVFKNRSNVMSQLLVRFLSMVRCTTGCAAIC